MSEQPYRFRKRPVEIEAIQFAGDNPTPIIAWVLANGGTARYHDDDPAGDHIAIDTLEGTMRADVGDWIIRGVAGEFYPVKDSIFRETYEAVDE